MVAYLASDVEPAASPHQDGKTFFIDDGNARLHALKDRPDTFQLISLKLLQQLPRNDVLFSTDMYIDVSVKSQAFLLNENNKTQLFNLMMRVWSSDDEASHVQNRNVMLVVQGRVFKFTSDGQSVQETEVPALRSNQEETDSRIIIYIAYAQEEGYDRVVVRSPDSDMCFILLSFVKFQLTIFFDIGSGLKRHLLNIKWDC